MRDRERGDEHALAPHVGHVRVAERHRERGAHCSCTVSAAGAPIVGLRVGSAVAVAAGAAEREPERTQPVAPVPWQCAAGRYTTASSAAPSAPAVPMSVVVVAAADAAPPLAHDTRTPQPLPWTRRRRRACRERARARRSRQCQRGRRRRARPPCAAAARSASGMHADGVSLTLTSAESASGTLSSSALACRRRRPCGPRAQPRPLPSARRPRPCYRGRSPRPPERRRRATRSAAPTYSSPPSALFTAASACGTAVARPPRPTRRPRAQPGRRASTRPLSAALLSTSESPIRTCTPTGTAGTRVLVDARGKQGPRRRDGTVLMRAQRKWQKLAGRRHLFFARPAFSSSARLLGGSAEFAAEPRDEPAKGGSISRNRRDEPHLRGCWFQEAARRNKKTHLYYTRAHSAPPREKRTRPPTRAHITVGTVFRLT